MAFEQLEKVMTHLSELQEEARKVRHSGFADPDEAAAAEERLRERKAAKGRGSTHDAAFNRAIAEAEGHGGEKGTTELGDSFSVGDLDSDSDDGNASAVESDVESSFSKAAKFVQSPTGSAAVAHMIAAQASMDSTPGTAMSYPHGRTQESIRGLRSVSKGVVAAMAINSLMSPTLGQGASQRSPGTFALYRTAHQGSMLQGPPKSAAAAAGTPGMNAESGSAAGAPDASSATGSAANGPSGGEDGDARIAGMAARMDKFESSFAEMKGMMMMFMQQQQEQRK